MAVSDPCDHVPGANIIYVTFSYDKYTYVYRESLYHGISEKYLFNTNLLI